MRVTSYENAYENLSSSFIVFMKLNITILKIQKKKSYYKYFAVVVYMWILRKPIIINLYAFW